MQLERDIHVERRGAPSTDGGAPLATLVRRLLDESRQLFRQEIGLAKLELKRTASSIVRDTVAMGIGLGLIAIGALALTAFLVLVVGNILGGAYWAGALIVGGVCLLVGAIVAAAAAKALKRQEVKPDETIRTLKEDKQWAAGEARDFRREVLS